MCVIGLLACWWLAVMDGGWLVGWFVGFTVGLLAAMAMADGWLVGWVPCVVVGAWMVGLVGLVLG